MNPHSRRISRKIEEFGLDEFNAASRRLKVQTAGRFKKFDHDLKLTLPSELQEVPDSNLLWVIEGMGLIYSNQSDRLRLMFTYRK